MAPELVDYVAGGCGDEHTQNANVTAFHNWGLMPRMLVGASLRDLAINLFGMALPSPVFMSPIGVLGLCDRDQRGEIAAARAARTLGVPFMASTFSLSPLEDVALELGDGVGFFQLYTPVDRAVAESFVHRAEAAGYKGIVVTLDTWVTGWRPRDLNRANFPQFQGQLLANYFSDPVFRASLAKPPEDDFPAAIQKWGGIFGNPLTWQDVPWLRSLTKLPLIMKGICHPDDARRAIDMGIDGIFCSNHGGRQANGGIPAIDLLSDIVKASGDTPVLFDSGVRSGTDVVKALALGATAVGIGRPYAYGLALDGAEGIVHVLRSLLAEADLLMAVNGYPTLASLRAAQIIDIRRNQKPDAPSRQ